MNYRLKLFLFNISLIIFLAEIAIRITGIYATYSEKNLNRFESYYGKKLTSYYFSHPSNKKIINHQAEFNYTKYSNSIGLINKEIQTKQPETKRIIILGDSFTEGIGVPQDSSMPVLLNNILNQKKPNKFEVINAGIVGSDAFFEYYLLKDKLIFLQPDLVILNFNYSDFTDYIFRGGFERFKEDGTVKFNDAPALEKFYKYSHLLRAFVHFVLKYDFTLVQKNQLLQQYKKATHEILGAIERIDSLCKQNQTAFIVTLQPYPFSYGKEVPGYEYVDTLYSRLPQTSIKHINTYPAFNKVLTKSNYLNYSWEKDGHFNSKGYLLFAEIIFTKIDKKYPHTWQ